MNIHGGSLGLGLHLENSLFYILTLESQEAHLHILVHQRAPSNEIGLTLFNLIFL